MTDPRPDLNTVRTQYQVPDDQVITYRPRLYGAVDIPFTDGRQMTRTEGELLDRLTRDRGLMGLSDFRDIARDAFAQGEARFPNNPVPANIPADRAGEWQGNDGHRDAFRHAYWSARLAQEYGADWARAFTTAHEGLPGNFANREAMDLYNNSIGIQIGAANRNATPEQLANLVQQAVTRGETVVMNSGGNLEWSDRVPVGRHGLTPEDVIGPHLRTPGVVSTQSVAALDTPQNGRDGTALAAATPETRGLAGTDAANNIARMQDHPMYQQALTAVNAAGIPGGVDRETMAANVYAAAVREQLTTIDNVHVGNAFDGPNGRDQHLFVFGQRNGQNPQDEPANARLTVNEAANTPPQVAANNVQDLQQNRQQAAVEPETRKPMAMNA